MAVGAVAVRMQVGIRENAHSRAWTGRKCSGARDSFVAGERLDSVGDGPQRTAAAIVEDKRPFAAGAVIDVSPRLEKAGEFVERFYREQVRKCIFSAQFHRSYSLRRLSPTGVTAPRVPMQETPIYQGFLQFSDTYISICIVPFNADFIEMQWRSPWNLTIPPRGTGDHFIACETPPWVSHFLGQG
jgi:hypothetical protein